MHMSLKRKPNYHLVMLVGVLMIGILTGLLNRVHADTANLNLTLTIITPPQCTINGGDEMTVSFGQVQQGLIDGVSYKRIPIDYSLACTSVANNTLKMSLSWSAVTLNGLSAVQTNRNNLGIAIYQDATRLNNGASLNFNLMGTHPALYAAPVKPTGTMLSDAGAFYGAMTMTLNYQ
ncbi:MAG: fimbrial protein [Providencia heimbachae]|nr:fimbrial protein [Providencia heimbachae]